MREFSDPALPDTHWANSYILKAFHSEIISFGTSYMDTTTQADLSVIVLELQLHNLFSTKRFFFYTIGLILNPQILHPLRSFHHQHANISQKHRLD